MSELRRQLCEASWAAEVPEEYVRLITLSDPAAGMVFKATLESAGIPVIMQTYGPITGVLTELADNVTEDVAVLHVPKDRLDEARQLLEAIQHEPARWPEGMEPED